LLVVERWGGTYIPAGQKLAIRPFDSGHWAGVVELTSHELKGLGLALSVRHVCSCIRGSVEGDEEVMMLAESSIGDDRELAFDVR
jgi:hypothetical protein